MPNERSEYLLQAREEVVKAYEEVGLNMILEVLGIIDKYTNVTKESIIEFSVDELQADALRLTSFNFYIGTLANQLDADSARSKNRAKYEVARISCDLKRNDPKKTVADISNEAERDTVACRDEEIQAYKKSRIMQNVFESVQEMVNMLKKVVERILIQGQKGIL